jgi:thymidylate kinase
MLIILEGPDLAGKSTLTREIADEIIRVTGVTAVLMHKGPPDDRHILEQYELDLRDYDPGMTDVICDRWHVGETIYGPLLRGENRLTTPMLRHVNMFLESRGAVTVYVNPGRETLNTRWLENHDPLVTDHAMFERVREEYDRYFDTYPADYDERRLAGSPPSHPLLVVIAAERCAQRAIPFLRRCPTYVGSLDPQVCLIGDRRGGDGRGYPSAFVPYEASSGHYLLSAVDSAGLFELTRIGLFNACEYDSGDDLYEAWRELGQPCLIALGEHAHAALARVMIPHGAVPHPQFMRRFHNAARQEYGELITKTIETQEDNRRWRPHVTS